MTNKLKLRHKRTIYEIQTHRIVWQYFERCCKLLEINVSISQTMKTRIRCALLRLPIAYQSVLYYAFYTCWIILYTKLYQLSVRTCCVVKFKLRKRTDVDMMAMVCDKIFIFGLQTPRLTMSRFMEWKWKVTVQNYWHNLHSTYNTYCYQVIFYNSQQW